MTRDIADLEATLIRRSLCPRCGGPTELVEARHVRCLAPGCDFRIDHGCWNPEAGYCYYFKPDEEDN